MCGGAYHANTSLHNWPRTARPLCLTLFFLHFELAGKFYKSGALLSQENLVLWHVLEIKREDTAIQ